MELSTTLKSIDQTLNNLEKDLKDNHAFERQTFHKRRPMVEMDIKSCAGKGLEQFIKTGEMLESKGLSGMPDQMGRFLLPAPTTQLVEKHLNNLSPMRHVSRVTQVNGEGIDLILDQDDSGCGWTTEVEAGEETDISSLKRIHIGLHTMYARPRVSQRLLDDSFINLEEWLIEKISTKMACFENEAFTNGDGDNKPMGFASYGSAAQGRTAQQYEHLLSGQDGQITSADKLIDLIHLLDPIYHGRALWMMPRTALAAIRRIKDSDGQFIWQPGLSGGTPHTLLGYPIVINDNMPALAAGRASRSLAFGSFFDAYQIVEKSDIQILRDPYSAKPFIEFYATKRIGGDVINFEALKFIQFGER